METPGADVSRESFPYTELREDNIEEVLDINGADYSTELVGCQPQFLGPQLLTCGVPTERTTQMATCFAEQLYMA